MTKAEISELKGSSGRSGGAICLSEPEASARREWRQVEEGLQVQFMMRDDLSGRRESKCLRNQRAETD